MASPKMWGLTVGVTVGDWGRGDVGSQQVPGELWKKLETL